MKLIALCAGILVVAGTVNAKDLMVTVDGKEVKVGCTIMNREIKAQDKQSGSQSNAVSTSFLFYNYLAAGDLEKASQLATDPKMVKDKWAKYREGIDPEDFKRDMQEYFTTRYLIVAEIVRGEKHMLVVQPPTGREDAGGQIYVKTNTGFMLDERWDSEDATLLGKVLSMIQDGTLKLE